MSGEDDLGYIEYPKNGDSILRARTTRLIRSWQIPRSTASLKCLHDEMEKIDFPGLYLLFEGDKKIYVGEAKSVINRLKQHNKSPETKIKDWDKAIIINDGRPASQSDFNDNVIRQSLELYLINLFKTNKYEVVAQGAKQHLNPGQKHTVDALMQELLFFLKKRYLVVKDIEPEEEREIFSDEVVSILKKNKIEVNKWQEKNATLDGTTTFIRSGSKKSKGYQITIRGRKPGSFIDCLKQGTGNLLVRRGMVLLIPLKEIQEAIDDPATYEQDTVDIYIVFKDGKILLAYKDTIEDITHYGIS